MPKLKTRKAVSKKIKITARRKAIRLRANQNHFNSKDPGSVTRRKRRTARLFKTDEKNFLKALPYSK